MKASDILKKVEYIGAAEIQIVFKEEKADPARDMVFITEETTEESKEQIIKRASGYTVQEINIFKNILTLYAVRTAKREPKPKPEKPEPAAEQKQEGGEELEQAIRELEQEIWKMVEYLFTPIYEAITGFVDNTGRNMEKAGKKTKTVIRKARAAVSRILTRVFGKGAK